MVNNFDLIKELLKFESPDDFYFVQVIQRKKDHKDENKRLGRNNNARLVKAYYVESIKYLEEHQPEMIALAEMFNARVGINLNIRSRRQVAYEMLEQLAMSLKAGNHSLAKLYNSCCGMVHSKDKLWLIDVDEPKVSPLMLADIEYKYEPKSIPEFDEVGMPIPGTFKSKIVAQIPTKNGWHVITTPFNSLEFSKDYPEIEIHKNNPTILYIPNSKT